MRHPDYFQVLVAVDQLINTFFGGMADETLSSRAHRMKIERGRKWVSAVNNVIFFWQTDHCEEAYESELKRAHLPETMRGYENV